MFVMILSNQIDAQPHSIPKRIHEALLEKNGKTWVIKRLSSNIILVNGVIVKINSKVKMPDGKTYHLYRGDAIDFEGHFVGLGEQFDSAVVKYYGVWVWALINQPTIFKNGIYVSPDGIVETKKGTYRKLKEGEALRVSGEVIINQSALVQNK